MAGPSDSLRNAIIEHFYRGNAQTARGGTLYVSLHTADPGRTGASELSGSGYARQAVTFDPAAGGATDAVADVVFPANSGGAAYTVSHIGLWDAVTGGNYHDGAALAGGAKTVAVGANLRIPSADLDVVGV
jgi:hypothetical protein